MLILRVTIAGLDPASSILWESLGLSAEALRARSDILVVAQVEARKPERDGYSQYRVQFELNKHHGLVAHEVQFRGTLDDRDRPTWIHSIRRDLALAVRDHFLTTQLYMHLAHQLGWFTKPTV